MKKTILALALATALQAQTYQCTMTGDLTLVNDRIAHIDVVEENHYGMQVEVTETGFDVVKYIIGDWEKYFDMKIPFYKGEVKNPNMVVAYGPGYVTDVRVLYLNTKTGFLIDDNYVTKDTIKGEKVEQQRHEYQCEVK